MLIRIEPSMNLDLATSINYPRIKHVLFNEINSFCKEKHSIRNDLHSLRVDVGMAYSYDEIKAAAEVIKDKYTPVEDNFIGVDFIIEETRYDYGLTMFVIIQRDIISAKQFTFRYKKKEYSERRLMNAIQTSGEPSKSE